VTVSVITQNFNETANFSLQFSLAPETIY